LAEIHQADGLHFNLSHTHGKSVLAFARGYAVGVDVERCVDPGDLDKLAETCFSARELAEYQSLSSDDRLRGFYNGWTRKEAYLKATGEGLQRPLASFSVSLTPSGDPRLLEIDGDRHVANAWAIHDLTPRESLAAFVFALAIRAPHARVTSRGWETLT
jgi:4'-phosphopantetheinyl transferase